jgi:hypothetical protein
LVDETRSPATVVRSVILQAEEGSEVTLDELRIDYLSDGHRSLHGRTVPTKATVVNESFSYIVNVEGGTYRTLRLEKGDEVLSESASPDLPPPGDGCCANECDGSMAATVTTYDPINCSLTRTTSNGNWHNHMNIVTQACQWTGSGNGTCWAANPSCANTHWTKSTCYQNGPNNGPFYFYLKTTGNYYNYDFMNPSLRTDVSQWVALELNFGQPFVEWDQAQWGEYSD